MKKQASEPLNRKKGIVQMIVIFLLFTAITVLLPDWHNKSTQLGGVVGAVCLLILVLSIVFRKVRRLNKRELSQTKRSYMAATSWTITIPIAGSVMLTIYFLRESEFLPYIVGFCSVVMVGLAIIAIFIPVLRLGVYQDSK